jgi:trigger factor
MKTEVKKLPKSILELTIEETAENISKYRKKVLENISKNAQIKWFRKGATIPESVIVKEYWEERIYQMIIDEALNHLYREALKKNNIMPISQWEIVEITSQSPLIVKMHIEVFPEIEVSSDYKKVKVKKTPIKLEKNEVEDTLKEIQSRFTKFEKAWDDYSAKMWDKLIIDTTGFDLDGNKLENTSMEKYPLVLGSNVLVPGFEEGLVGKKAWESVSLDIIFPKDYHNADFAWKKTKFEVKIHEIESSIVPEFTPEFIKDLRGKDLDLEGFKKLIEEELTETKETNARIGDENKLVEELLKYTTMDIWDALLKNHTEKVFEEIKGNITQSGAKPLDYINSLWLTEESYVETQVKPIALKRLQAELILHKLWELEKTEVSEEEMNDEIKKIMDRFGSSEVLERLKDLYKPGTRYYEELKQRLTYRKLIDTFFE